MPAYRVNGKNVLFIHIPKTGGTSVEDVLSAYSRPSFHGGGDRLVRQYRHWPVLERHIPLQHFHGELLSRFFAEGFFDFVFMVVRDPVARLVSEYSYSRHLGRPDGRLGFSAWSRLMLAIAARAPAFRSNHFRPQSDFLCLGARVYRFEDGLDSIVRDVCTRIGVPAPETLPHARRSSHELAAVGEASLARIARFYEADYRQFGYAIQPH